MQQSEILFYSVEGGQSKIEVRLENETVWLSQLQMVELFQTTKQNISFHINNIYKEKELEEAGTVKDYLTAAADGKKDLAQKLDEMQINIRNLHSSIVFSKDAVGFRKLKMQLFKKSLIMLDAKFATISPTKLSLKR